MKTRILATINQKGGVGKTTTAANVGYRLAELGKRVLLIDGDEQANLSLIFNAINSKETLFKLFITDEPVQPIEVSQNLHIIPSDIQTSNINAKLAGNIDAPFFLKKYLALPEYSVYDIIIIDCAPALDSIIINTLVAADAMLVTLSPGEFAYDGMQRILSAMRAAQRNYRSEITLGGIVMSMVNDRTKVYQQTMELLTEDQLLPSAFTTNIRICEAFKQAEAEHKTIFEFAPRSKGALDMSALTEEIIDKILK